MNNRHLQHPSPMMPRNKHTNTRNNAFINLANSESIRSGMAVHKCVQNPSSNLKAATETTKIIYCCSYTKETD